MHRGRYVFKRTPFFPDHLWHGEETPEAPRRRQEPDGLGGYGHRPPPTRTGDHLLDKELFRAQEGKGG